MRHRNFINFMYSLVRIDMFNKNDIMVQMASCTFDAHVQEVLGALIFSAVVVMLHPHGNMETLYLAQTLQNKQITYILSVPTVMTQLCGMIESYDIHPFATIRTLCCVGM
jgi:non-ribosomal peptide synthetase component F